MNEWGRQRRPFLFLIDFEMNRPLVIPEEDAGRHGIRVAFCPDPPVPVSETAPVPVRFRSHPVPYETYRKAFHIVRNHILDGNSYLVNLTFPTPVETSLTLEDIYNRSTAPYSLLWEDRFVVFSPETFVRIRDRRITSFPMKGTISAAVPMAEQVLLNDPKELAEHHTIVDLIRNDLSLVSKGVRVDRFRYIDRVRTHSGELLQASSEISGRLEEGFESGIGDLMFGLLPAGSVSGAPKHRTLQIIREAEPGPRGFYTGVMGRFDGQNLDSAVMIRFIEKTHSGLVFRSGGGITCNSDPESEYRELIDKVYVPFA